MIIDNSVNRKETVYNFIAMLREHSDLSEKQILALSDAFAQGSSGNMRVTLGGISYYLVYEGTAVQNWTMLGLCRSGSSMPVWISCGSIPYRLWRASP